MFLFVWKSVYFVCLLLTWGHRIFLNNAYLEYSALLEHFIWWQVWVFVRTLTTDKRGTLWFWRQKDINSNLSIYNRDSLKFPSDGGMCNFYYPHFYPLLRRGKPVMLFFKPSSVSQPIKRKSSSLAPYSPKVKKVDWKWLQWEKLTTAIWYQVITKR